MHVVRTALAFIGASAALVAAAPVETKKGAEKNPNDVGISRNSYRLVQAAVAARASSTVMQRPVPPRFRSLEERRQIRREELKKKHKHKKKGKKVDPEESGNDDPDSGDVDESGEDHETDESGKSNLDDDTNSGDTDTGDTDDDDEESETGDD